MYLSADEKVYPNEFNISVLLASNDTDVCCSIHVDPRWEVSMLHPEHNFIANSTTDSMNALTRWVTFLPFLQGQYDKQLFILSIIRTHFAVYHKIKSIR